MISIRAIGVGKAYRVYKRPVDSLKELLLRRTYSEAVWALRDVTLEVAQGSSLGVIGDNGAGKSTLLRLLSGALRPTIGDVERNGRIAALLHLGAGFHPDLSGLDNVRIGCAVLGASPAEAEALLPAIVEFSELDRYMTRPVRTYSSGMYLRLAFSVATAVQPDILVVDEHLSVGDQHFRHKCLQRIVDLRAAGCTLIFCSHDLHSVGEVCERALWLRDGRPVMLAATAAVLSAYQDDVRARDVKEDAGHGKEQMPEGPQFGGETALRDVALGGDCRDGCIETGGTLTVRVLAQLSETARRDGVQLGLLVVRNDGVWCYGVSTKMDGLPADVLHPVGDGTYGLTFVLEDLALLSGQYSFIVALLDDRTPHLYDVWKGVATFQVRHAGKDIGVARLRHRWERP